MSERRIFEIYLQKHNWRIGVLGNKQTNFVTDKVQKGHEHYVISICTLRITMVSDAREKNESILGTIAE